MKTISTDFGDDFAVVCGSKTVANKVAYIAFRIGCIQRGIDPIFPLLSYKSNDCIKFSFGRYKRANHYSLEEALQHKWKLITGTKFIFSYMRIIGQKTISDISNNLIGEDENSKITSSIIQLKYYLNEKLIALPTDDDVNIFEKVTLIAYNYSNDLDLMLISDISFPNKSMLFLGYWNKGGTYSS